ncbi:MAG: LytTR family DNA-binding domain-containing protein [Cyclobacteriaceae bacterium]|nr:response regulator transcription factor [Cyclobacteriaceae bacterium]MCH8515951.1 LytTR family DNA-binding domain-containing protein [Cyclobacteriaceae bacterium]
MVPFKCLVVDDDPVSRRVVSRFIEKTDFLVLKDELDDSIDASNYLSRNDIDIIFLDIQMPEMNGFELLRTLKDDYEVILVSNSDNHASEAFESGVTDYIVKPIDYPRFLKAVSKARYRLMNNAQLNVLQNNIMVRSEGRLVNVKYDDIEMVEAMADYVVIWVNKKKLIVHSTMKGVLKKLPEHMFARVHRSHIVNLNKVEFIDDGNVFFNDRAIPIGASYKHALYDKMNIL